MFKRLMGCLTCAAMAQGAAAEPAPAASRQKIIPAASMAAAPGPAEYFTGRVSVTPRFPATSAINVSGGLVAFEPGARSAWHTHPAGQQLVVMSGQGLTQEWGQPIQVIRAGDVVWCPPGVKHWHGAAPGSAMTHLAITGSVDGRNVDWLEKVSDEQYLAASATLSTRQIAIGPVAAATATGDMAQLATALEAGLDAGLSVGELKEVLVQLYAYAGFPRSLNALGRFMKVLEARRAGGIVDVEGPPPEPALAADRSLQVGTDNQTRLSGAPVRGPLFEFAPAIDQFLKAHLFGDIFSRDGLDWQSRELATVAALAAMDGVESQLQSHVRIAIHIGLTAGQLGQLGGELARRGAARAGERLKAALDQHLGSVKP